MKVVEIKYGQSLFDIAIQEYGSVEGVFWLVEDNNLSGIVDNVYEGDTLNVRETIINKQVITDLREKTIATLYSDKERAQGLGYMEIERNFDVE